MKNKKTIVAICYDFDKTLCPEDMQNYTIIPKLGYDNASEFWAYANSLCKEHSFESIVGALFVILKEARAVGYNLTYENLKSEGKNVDLFDGVLEWFDKINAYGEKLGITVEHYIISAGIKEIIEGTPIAKHFKYIYASSYFYDNSGHAVWPRIIINDISKTQMLYRINKGCLDETDASVNDYLPHKNRRISFENLIYIGDSLTDIPCMSITQDRGGYAIGVYNPKDETKGQVQNMIQHDRIDFYAPADYSENSELFKIVKKCLDTVKAKTDLEKLTERQKHSPIIKKLI